MLNDFDPISPLKRITRMDGRITFGCLAIKGHERPERDERPSPLIRGEPE